MGDFFLETFVHDFCNLICFLFYRTLLKYKKGINASGIRKVIKAPSRYAIPLIVTTGIPYNQSRTSLSIGNRTVLVDDRYKMEDFVFGNTFGSSIKK
jgi:hypothetical protein